MKATSSYKMSKWIKTALALTPWESKDAKNSYKRSMVTAELHHFANSKKALSRLPESIDAK